MSSVSEKNLLTGFDGGKSTPFGDLNEGRANYWTCFYSLEISSRFLFSFCLNHIHTDFSDITQTAWFWGQMVDRNGRHEWNPTVDLLITNRRPVMVGIKKTQTLPIILTAWSCHVWACLGLLGSSSRPKDGQSEAELSGNESTRYEDFQSSCRSETMWRYPKTKTNMFVIESKD